MAELERLGMLLSKTAQIEQAAGLRRVGRAAAAVQALEKILARPEELAPAELAQALSLLASAKRDVGDIEGAVDAHTKAEYAFGAIGDAAAQARDRCALGRLHVEQGRLGEAQRAFVDVLAMGRAGVEISSTILAQAGLVEVRARRGDASDAVDTMTEGLAQARNDGLRDAEIACLTALAYVEGLLGDPAKSDEAYESALKLMRSAGTHRQAAFLHAMVAERRAARGDVARAQEALRAAEAVAGVGRDPHTVAAIGLARGSILEQSGDLTGALAAYWETVDTARRAGAGTVDRAGCVLSGQLDPDPSRAAGYIRGALRALAAEGDRAIFVIRPALACWLRDKIESFGIPAEERAAVMDLLTVRAASLDAPVSRGGLQVSLLGALDVRIGGQRISDRAWRTSKAKELFSLLLIHRDRMLGRDEIIERLWPETEPGSGISNFHFTLHALRKALASTKDAKAPSVRTEGGYQLVTADRSPIDVDVFTLLLHEGNRFRRLGRSDDAVRLFRAGTALYRADLLTDLDAEWVTERREDLVRQYLSALRQLAELELEREEGAAAAAACRRFLEREPYDEHVHRVLLRAYRGSGDTALVDRHYRSLTHLLKSELGTEPERETTQLYERLRGKDTRLGPVAPVRVIAR
jgi:DNA-binding SARP family transcriptional activator